MFRKIIYKSYLYLLLDFLIYILLILFNIFTSKVPDTIESLIFSAFFILEVVTSYIFLKSNYERFYHYKSKIKIILSITSFAIVDVFAQLIEINIIQGVNISLSVSLCAFVFSFMMTLLSALAKDTFPNLSRILYYIGLFELFAGNLVAIINLFKPII